MKKKIFLVLICVLLAVTMLVGCTESYKADAIPMDTADKTVSSNGGLSVKYGKYLFYINGLAGKDVPNTFGEPQKGAIARVTLQADGTPDMSTNIIVVPKNAYSTVATSGLYIVDDYIYYSTPSIDKDKEGKPKTAEMRLMRTKLDGTGTQTIASFKDYTTVYKIVSGYVLYFAESEIHQINLNSKKFEDTTISTEVTAQYFPNYADNTNAFIDTVFFLKASEITTNTNNVLWAYRAGGAAVKVIEANTTCYPSQKVDFPTGFTLALAESQYIKDGIRLFYTKTDGGTNKKSEGTYSYDFVADDFTAELKFVEAKEVRYSYKNNYTNIKFLDSNNMLAISGNNYVNVNKKDTEKWTDGIVKNVIKLAAAPTIFDIRESETDVSVYYVNTSVLYKISILSKENGEYKVAIKPASVVFSGKYDTTWVTMDRVENSLYFFNSDVINNMYYLNYINVTPRNEATQKAKLLGMMTNADEISMIA